MAGPTSIPARPSVRSRTFANKKGISNAQCGTGRHLPIGRNRLCFLAGWRPIFLCRPIACCGQRTDCQTAAQEIMQLHKTTHLYYTWYNQLLFRRVFFLIIGMGATRAALSFTVVTDTCDAGDNRLPGLKVPAHARVVDSPLLPSLFATSPRAHRLVSTQ